MQEPVTAESNTEIRLLQKLKRDLGNGFLKAFEATDTVEIMLNPDGCLWVETLGQGIQRIGTLSSSQAEAAMRTIAACLNTTITRDSPLLEGEFPIDGSRFAGQFPPVVTSPSFSIRKKTSKVLKLADYVESGVISTPHVQHIHAAIKLHRNILISGGTGSGKTTLANALLNEIVTYEPDQRLIIIEDTAEIRCFAKNQIKFHTSLEVNMTQLLKTSLRMRPDRIVVGEVRGPEALDLLMAWNTGHEGGVGTLHANDARSALTRLTTLVSMHSNAPRAIEPLVAQAVDLIIQIQRTPTGRKVTEVLQVEDFQQQDFLVTSL